ncbi:MAG: N-acetyltransferase [Caulobacterales bacterium]
MRPPETATLPETLAEILIQPEAPQHCDAVEGLFDEGFGPGRFAKTAERLREGNVPLLGLSRVALKDGEVIAAGRVWLIEIGGAPVAYFGPFAVHEEERHHGLGRIIIDACVAAADEAGYRAMLLIGGASYFEPSGFREVPKGLLTLPGPHDPARLLWRALKAGGLDGLSGAVTLPRAAKP